MLFFWAENSTYEKKTVIVSTRYLPNSNDMRTDIMVKFVHAQNIWSQITFAKINNELRMAIWLNPQN